ncbi:hypothetical protein GCM10027423_62420 [Spirosoma arcticum]
MILAQIDNEPEVTNNVIVTMIAPLMLIRLCELEAVSSILPDIRYVAETPIILSYNF